MGKKKKAKAAQDNGQAGGAGGATAMQVEAVVVGAHCAELYPSLILRVGPESQLLFQAGAGLQRYCGENHVRLKNTSHVLLSTVSAATTSGLPGTILTLADMGQKKLTIVGPAGTADYIKAAAAAGFMNRPEQQLNTVDVVQGTELWDPPRGIEITSVVVNAEEHREAATVPVLAVGEDDAVEPPAKRRATERSVHQPARCESGSTPVDVATTSAVPAEPVQLFVGNLPFSVEQEMLREAFDRFGGAIEAKIIMDRQTGKPRGFGFVTMSNSVAAEAAIDSASLGLVSLDGRPLRVGRADRSGSTDSAGTGWVMRGNQSLPGVQPPPSSAISYICQLPTSRGKFNKAKAVELGVKVGPDFGKLAAGQSVTTADGTVVKPSDVVGETVLGACLLVVACPTRTALESLAKSDKIAALYTPVRQPQQPLFVAHFTPASVACRPEYMSWMHRFGSDARHMLLYTPPSTASGMLFSDTSATAGREMPAFVASATLAAKLAALNPSFFPWPAEDMALASTVAHNFLLKPPCGAPETTVIGRSGLRIVLSPAAALGVDDVQRSEKCKNIAAALNSSELSDWLKNADGVETAVAAVATATTSSKATSDDTGGTGSTSAIPNDAPVCQALAKAGRETGELLFLGTGSASPSKYRNVSAILLSLPTGRIMLDCGEGTYGQLVRRFGVGNTGALLRSLRCIFITHMHADHHLGIIELLENRKAAFSLGREVETQQQQAVSFSAQATWPWWPWSSDAVSAGAAAADDSSSSTSAAQPNVNLNSMAQTEEDILIVAPTQLGQWLRRYHATVHPIFPERGAATFCSNAALTPNSWKRWPNAYSRPSEGSDLKGFDSKVAVEARTMADEYLGRTLGVTLRCCDVDHPAFSSGAIITSNTIAGERDNVDADISIGDLAPPQAWKLVYSGDTRPCEQLHRAGDGATVLIHEATMENDLEEMALQKRHSTTAEAVADGLAVRAERTILTHFSQRYPKLSPWMDMAATMAAKQAKAEAQAEEKAATAAQLTKSVQSEAAAGLPAAQQPCGTFPPGVSLNSKVGTELSSDATSTITSSAPDGLPPPPGVYAKPAGASSSEPLPRLASGTSERKLQDYYERQTGIAFDLMTVNFADLEHMPGALCNGLVVLSLLGCVFSALPSETLSVHALTRNGLLTTRAALKPAIRALFEIEEPELNTAAAVAGSEAPCC